MQFRYKARTSAGADQSGIIDAGSVDLAVGALQRRNLIVISIEPAEEEKSILVFHSWSQLLSRVHQQDLVILSRQLATLFQAKVPIVESFKVLMSETENVALRRPLAGVLDDIEGGLALSSAMERHPDVFSRFYVAMIKSGEESGKLEEVFTFLADYLERTYELARKARNALIYPGFVLGAFIAVMTLMLVFVIPKIATILTETGQTLPIYTRIVIWMSDFVRGFGVVIGILAVIVGAVLYRYAMQTGGKMYFARLRISLPIVGGLYRKIYLSRIADNLHTLLSSGITVVRALIITAEVVDNEVYRQILLEAVEEVKGGNMISEVFARYKDIPPLFSQMLRIGEETGRLDYILKSVSGFYTREVNSMVDNLVSLIEPILILVLGLGVGLLVASVLIPIYSLSATF